jgi:gamma-glutamylaminecyclotransferase
MAHPRGSTRLFVYGTLLRGEPNHALLASSPCLGAVRTEPAFDLVLFDGYPAMVAGGSIAVTGELYAVTRTVLKRLDRLENHPRLYRRIRIRLADVGAVEAYLITARQAFGMPRIPSGDWRQSRTAPHTIQDRAAPDPPHHR